MGNCQVCGKPSGFFPLCNECNKKKEEGKVVKCPDCGTWHEAEKTCSCKPVNVQKQKEEKANTCVICGEKAPNGSLCRECYYEMQDFKETFDKNKKPFELKDYYFNLKSNIYRMQNFEFIQNNSNKLFSIATLLKEQYKDSSLMDRVVEDAREIIETKKPKAKAVIKTEYSQTQDSQKETLIRAKDGHMVKSDAEANIDDILYELGIVHCYGKRVSEISDGERTMMCDWFLPVLGTNQGIYVEYWGMETGDYIKNKEEKRSLYKEHEIPLIEINKDDAKGDHQGLSDRIKIEANRLAEKVFRIKGRFNGI